MKRRQQRRQGRGAIELIEEALYLLRHLPVAGLAAYYAGSLPFVLGFLYFWADMSRGAFAEQSAGRAALAVTGLFVWMKCWQAYFSATVRAFLGGNAMPRVPFTRMVRIAITQTAIQSTGLFLLPLGLLTAAPFGWLYAFYQNVSYYGDGSIPEVRLAARHAWRQAGMHPGQNHVLIFLLSTFGLFVFLNLLSIGYLLPALLKTFFGIETVFSMAGWHLLNTTFLAVVCAATYLITNPLNKTVYALRCFYGDALATGEDLSMEMSRLKSGQRAASLLLVLGLTAGLLASSPASAAEHQAAPAQSARISDQEMNQSLERVVTKREYAWRLPRLQIAKEEKDNPIFRFMKSIAGTVEGWCAPVKRWMRKAIKWFFENVLEKLRIRGGVREPAGDWQGPLMAFFGILLAAVAGFLGVAVYRMWKRRQRSGESEGEEVPPMPISSPIRFRPLTFRLAAGSIWRGPSSEAVTGGLLSAPSILPAFPILASRAFSRSAVSRPTVTTRQSWAERPGFCLTCGRRSPGT